MSPDAGMRHLGSDAVISGLGIFAPTGIGIEAHWQALLAGKTGVERISHFDPREYPVQLAGEVPEFEASERVVPRLIPQTDRWTHLALAAADAALDDAAIDPGKVAEYDLAVVTSSSSGGTEFGQREMTQLYSNGPKWVGAYQSIAWFYAATTGQISIRHGMRGPCGVLCGEQAGGLDALAHARRLVRRESQVVLSGGTDASLCPYGLVAQLATGGLSTELDPMSAYRPFDATAAGYVPGEGGAIIVVERGDVARRRGRGEGYGRILGYAAAFDPQPGTNRPPVLARTIRRALADARIEPCDVGVVFADGIGLPDDDRAEAEAISAVFGDKAVPVTVPKTLTGRLYGGGAPLDVATALLTIRDGVIPHTVGTNVLASGCDIDLVLNEPRERQVRAALVVARGYGGFNAAMVVGRGPSPDVSE